MLLLNKYSMLIEGREIKKSTRKNKKYMVKVGNRWVHWGDSRYQQYKDQTPLKAYSHLDHLDAKRRTLLVFNCFAAIQDIDIQMTSLAYPSNELRRSAFKKNGLPFYFLVNYKMGFHMYTKKWASIMGFHFTFFYSGFRG